MGIALLKEGLRMDFEMASVDLTRIAGQLRGGGVVFSPSELEDFAREDKSRSGSADDVDLTTQTRVADHISKRGLYLVFVSVLYGQRITAAGEGAGVSDDQCYRFCVVQNGTATMYPSDTNINTHLYLPDKRLAVMLRCSGNPGGLDEAVSGFAEGELADILFLHVDTEEPLGEAELREAIGAHRDYLKPDAVVVTPSHNLESRRVIVDSDLQNLVSDGDTALNSGDAVYCLNRP